MRIRLATPADAGPLIEFNAAMALETEGKELLTDVIGAGVRSLLGNPAAGFYLLAEQDSAVGSLMITKEWSDWRNGTFWWIQSVYVRPQFRRQGVYKNLYRHVQELASKDPAVCGFRLYVERENERAQATYSALGMKQTRYLVFEELKPGVRFYR
ncbi:MAG TPA: GNAT family N-acetyltransferase [Burkholderiales bacterium]|jgi:ribosomal protein S18 acetylase RimI-like enzyme|nr:GNAT family N-acetyltransferase [Burkholderiales bacterium]